MGKLSKLIQAASEASQRRTWVPRPEVLLHPQIPKPMHGVNPRTVLGKEWWNATRKAVYQSTDHHCIACEVHKYLAQPVPRLDGHELYEIDYLLGRMTYVETVPLCWLCHNFIHSGRLQNLLDTGKITKELYNQVLTHGEQVLRKAGLTKQQPCNRVLPDWDEWRLVAYGKEYPPLFKSYEEWSKHFEQGVS